eukprot:GHVU01007618.1.p1 GENE.GHVU01007618.1~~GHVU01007618.1.p1  ORF type:complete len:223 (+),score=40.04 GHVU01007618.1:244-912(+)
MNLFSLPMMTLVVSTLSLVITFHYYVNMLRLTRHLQQANTFNVIHSEYASPKTLEAMELIEDFIEDVGVDKYGFEFWQLRSQKKEKGRLLERARRRLVHFYTKLQFMYELGYFTEEYLRKFPGTERAKRFVDLIEPLEYLSRRYAGREHAPVFGFLRRLYNLPSASLEHLEETSVIQQHLAQHQQPQLPTKPLEENSSADADTPSLPHKRSNVKDKKMADEL